MKYFHLLFTALALLAIPLRAAELRIEEMLFDAQGRPKFTFNPKSDSYYVLYRGEQALDIIHPTRLALGRPGARLMDASSFTNAPSAFFQVREIPYAQPLDLDGDGVDDVREILSNSDPLDPQAVPTGFRTREAVTGTAVDVTTGDNLAFVAASAGGVAIHEIGVGLSPIPLTQISTPGTALAVAYTAPWLVVADGAVGAAVLVVTNPSLPVLTHYFNAQTLGGGVAQAAAAVADLAFIGTDNGSLSLVHLSTGLILQQTNFAGRIEDLVIEGTTLYAYANGRLHVIPFTSGRMEADTSIVSAGTINTANGRGRLFVGNHIAYVVHRAGYNTFDVSTPAAPTLLATRNTADLGWKQIVLNGAGLGLAAVGRNAAFTGTHPVALYDTSDATAPAALLTNFVPGIARAVSIYKGLGYVAAHSNGLSVVNYLTTDTNGQPPTITLTPEPATGDVVSGTLITVRAEALDESQVRAVDFFIDGQPAATDGSFPFEFTFRVPVVTEATTLTVTARVADTGGNTGDATPITVTIQPCSEPLFVTLAAPSDGREYILVGDDLPIRIDGGDTTCTTLGRFDLVSAVFDIGGQVLPARRVAPFEWVISTPLPPGGHLLRAVVTDTAGRVGETFAGISVRTEALSAQVTLFNLGTGKPEAISREVSLFNLGLEDLAVSREVTIFNLGTGQPEALSREVSVVNTNNRPCVVAPIGLRHWWPFADHPNDIRSNANFTAAGNIQYPLAKAGLGAFLDGAVDYFSLDQTSVFRGSNAFSIALWMRSALPSDTNRMALVTQADANNSSNIVRLSMTAHTGRIAWSVRGGGQQSFPEMESLRAVNNGQFHHVVATLDTNGTARIYIDGTLDASQSGQRVSLAPARFSAGIDLRDLELFGEGSLFHGWLDELQIYDRALTPADASALFEADSAGVCRP